MSRQIDLMPEASRKRLGQRRVIRRWAALYAVSIGAIALSAFLLTVWERGLRRSVEELRVQVELDADQRARATALQAQISTKERLLERHDALTWPIAYSEVFEVVGLVAPESVSLRSFSVTPREDRRKRRDDREERAGRLVVELTGLAPDDFHLANFVGGLETHPLFSRVVVDYARESALPTGTARDFGVTCEIDLTKRFVASAAPEEEAS